MSVHALAFLLQARVAELPGHRIANILNPTALPAQAEYKIAMLSFAVIAGEWRWELRYPDYGIGTANEIHVAATSDSKHATYLQLQSVDIIHREDIQDIIQREEGTCPSMH